MAIATVKAVSNTRVGQQTAFVVVGGLFAVWGLALWLYNALFHSFAQFFAFDAKALAWTLCLFSFAYFISALPAALFHRQFGYKLGVLCGLSIFALGAFLLYLAIIQHSYGAFLAAVVMVGVCGAWLDTALNPLAVEAGPSSSAVVRLNSVQCFNGFGLLAGCLVARWLVEGHYQLTAGAAAQLSARPYVLVGLAAIFLAFLLEQTALPAFATNRVGSNTTIRAELRALVADPRFVVACLALGAYFVVLTVIWSSYRLYSNQELPSHSLGLIERGFFWFAIGRCVGTGLMRWIAPQRLLQLCLGLSVIATVLASALGGVLGWLCLLSVSFFLAILFPTIFGFAITGLGARTKLAAGVLATAGGIGNALAPLFVTPALAAWNIRLVVLLAVPFLALLLRYALVPQEDRKPVGDARRLGVA